MGLIFLLSACGTSGFTLFSGAVMVQKGISVSDTVLYLGISTTGQFLGTLLSAAIVDRVERRLALMICAVAMAVALLGFVLSSTTVPLLVAGVAFSILMALYLPALFVYATELFPTARRSSATSIAWAANRVSSALIPFVLLPLLRQSGAVAMATVIGVALLLAAVLVFAFAPRTR
jgi:putative MFS transporter